MMPFQKPSFEIIHISFFLRLVHDSQANKVWLRLGRARPERKVSSCRELEVSSSTGAGLSDRLDAESEDEDERSGVGDTIWRACAMVFFFFFAAGERTAGEESCSFSPDPFSPSAFLNVPSYLFSSHWSRYFWRTFASASRALL